MPSQKSGSVDLLEDPPKVVLAVDPGLATGWALLVKGKDTYAPHDFGVFRGLDALEQGLIDFKYSPDLVVYEDFKLFKWKALQQSGSKMEVTRAIGSLTFWARTKGIPTEAQGANILPIAVMWSKMPLPKNHDNSHHISAMNHGIYYLVKNGLMTPLGM